MLIEPTAEDLRTSLLRCTPAPERLINVVHGRSTSSFSPLHGEEHWRAVAHAGLVVGAATPGTDLAVVFLFGLVHDAMRVNEHDDPEHGARVADLVSSLTREGLLHLSDGAERMLASACRLHSDGLTDPDPTVGVCWDADRLNLWRLGWTPAVEFLSTREARKPERVAWAREALAHVPSWAELLSGPYGTRAADDHRAC